MEHTGASLLYISYDTSYLGRMFNYLGHLLPLSILSPSLAYIWETGLLVFVIGKSGVGGWKSSPMILSLLISAFCMW